MKKTTIATALGIVIGGASMGANAALTSSATLSFGANNGEEVVACNYGTAPPCNNKAYNITDVAGSWFAMDDGDGIATKNEKTSLTSLNGIHLGTTQSASGAHTGTINGSENPNIDNPWTFFGGTGMHQTTSAIDLVGGVAGGTGTLDFSGWNVTWNGIASIPLIEKSATTISCDTSDCSDSSNYTISGEFHVSGGGFTTVTYFLNLEGHVTSSAVPVPAAVWLFGSGLLGLAGVARRRKSA